MNRVATIGRMLAAAAFALGVTAAAQAQTTPVKPGQGGQPAQKPQEQRPAEPPSADTGELSTNPFGNMHARIERTAFGVDVADVDVRLDEATAREIAQLARGQRYSEELAAKISRVATEADHAAARLTLLRDVSLGEFLEQARSDLERAREAGMITQAQYQLALERSRQTFARLRDRGLKEGDQLIYRVRPDALQTRMVSSDGQVLIETASQGEPVVLATFFSPGSSLRENLIRSLLQG